MGLADRVIFTGLRDDVPRLMLGAMDVFLLAVPLRGAAPVLAGKPRRPGCPVFFQMGSPDEVEEVKPLMRRISLTQPASFWAKRHSWPLTMPDRSLLQPEALKIIKKSFLQYH